MSDKAKEGIILRIDLTTGNQRHENTAKYEYWIGGIGIGEKILYDEVKPWMSPYDPGNKIIVSTGALSGTPFPGSGRLAAVTKSPMTMGITSGNAGGEFAAELKYAGFDHIVIDGHSPAPVYLWICDGKAEIRDAHELMGKDAWETDDWLKKQHGENVKTMCIGQAGENMVRFACATVDRHRIFGRCGFGAVMGSKNLKAIAVQGSGGVEIFDEKGFFDALDDMHQRLETREKIKPFLKYGTLACVPGKYDTAGFSYRHSQDLHIPEKMRKLLEPDTVCEKFRVCKSACFGCAIGCQSRYSITDGPYKGLTMEGTQFNSILNFVSKLDINDFAFCIKATTLCNTWGMDIDVVAEILGWAMECCEKGILDANDFDGLEPKFGDQKVALELIRKMAFRDGVGAVLAEGVARASTAFNLNSKYYAMHIKGNDLYEPLRSAIGYGLGCVVTTRGGSHVLGSPLCESSKISDHEFALKKFGITTYNQPLSFDGKPELVMHYEILTRMCSCIGMCIFASDWQEIHLLGFEEMTNLLNVSSGMKLTVEEFKKRMLALLNLEKVFNYTHAGFDRNDDYPPKRLMEEAVASGPAKGSVLEKERWDKMLDIYYDIHGWSRENGMPTPETLRDLKLDFAIDDLSKKAQAPGHAFL